MIDVLNQIQSNNEKVYLGEAKVHDGSRIMLYRHFIEALTRMAWLRCEDPKEFHRTLEKMIVSKLQPIFELKKRKTKDSSTFEASHNNNYSEVFEQCRTDVREIFKKELTKRQSGTYFTIDDTILVKTMFHLLSSAGIIQNDEDKWLFLQYVEKSHDPEESLSSILIETVNNTSSDKANKRKEKEVQTIKSKRMSFLVENELIYEEFEDILKSFMMKKKEHNVKTEADVLKYVSRNIEELKKTAFRQKKLESRIWPESEKDQKLSKLLSEKEAVRRLKEQKRLEEEQRKREERERELMKAEDRNILSEKELEALAEPEEASGEGGNESEESYF